MKNILTILMPLILFLSSCKKDDSSLNSGVTYEAKTSKGAFSDVIYTDANGGTVMLKKQANNWRITFKPTGVRPQVLYLSAISDILSTTEAEVTLNIFVDGKLVATTKEDFSAVLSHVLN